MAQWKIEGQYMETCNCSFICPCITSNLTARPTEGDCKAAIAMRIDRGQKDGVDLGGVRFVVMLHSPGPMAEGNITAGLVIDESASAAQVEAVTAIASGGAGGPMGALAPLVGAFAGVERAAVRFEQTGLSVSSGAGDLLDQAIEGVPSVVREGEAICLDNVAHPIGPKLALAHARRSRMNVFGIAWDDSSGTRNGHFAPFAWAG